MPEQLNHLTPLPFWLRHLKEEDKPHYTDCEKRIIAFSIAFEGTITIDKHKQTINTKEYTHYPPNIAISNTDFELLDNFHKIFKFGTSHIQPPRKKTENTAKVYSVHSVYEVTFLLQQLKGFMPCEKYRNLRSLVAEFCQSRIYKHENNLDLSYDKRELEIIQEVRKLNERGRKP